MDMWTWGLGMATESDEVATQALVIMLTCINMNWKIPIGYFLISGIDAEQKTRLMWTALELFREAGIDQMYRWPVFAYKHHKHF